MPDMRFAPPNPLRIADRSSGLNAVSVRSYNERLVLSLMLQSKTTTRLEIGDRTGLSAQTVSVIIRTLEQEGLVAKGEAQKGRVGPPTVPLTLNAEGAFSVGISVGTTQTDIVLIDFVGSVRHHVTIANPATDISSNHSAFLSTITEAVEKLPARARERLAGVGLALAHSTTRGHDEPAYFKALQSEIESQLGISVFVQNDITAAAAGESMFGVAKPLNDYLFFYLGANLHGRLILNHQIHKGNSTLSFDVGISGLEAALREAGQPVDALRGHAAAWPDFGAALGAWEDSLIEQMKKSYASVTQFVDIKTLVLSSYAPHSVCQEICAKFEKANPGVKAIAGVVAPSPKAVGAAALPFSSRFMVE